MKYDNFIYYAQAVMLMLNILAIIILKVKDYRHKGLRIVLALSVMCGIIINFGQVSWFTFILVWLLYFSLLNYKPDGFINRTIESIGDFFRRSRRSLEGREGDI